MASEGFLSRVLAGEWPDNLVSVTAGDLDQPISYGAGLLVGRWHVLTCEHVLQKAKKQNRPEHERRPIAGKLTVGLRNGQTIAAQFVASDPEADIALLKLEARADCWERMNLAPTPTAECKVVALGFSHPPARRFGAQLSNAYFEHGGYDEGLLKRIRVEGSAPEGYSGGPVFAEDAHGAPILIGLSRLGGDQVDWGKLIAVHALLAFAAGHLDTVPNSLDLKSGDPEGAAARRRDAQRWGGRGEAEVDGWGPFWFQADKSHAPAYVAVLPVTTASVSLARGQDWSRAGGGLQCPYSPLTAEDTLTALDTLCKRTGRSLRLPTVQEMERLCTQISLQAGDEAAQPLALLGAPPDMRFFGTVSRPNQTPNGVLEWLETDSGPGLFRISNQGKPISAPDARNGVPILRAAFDA
ncbi:hypothetical protein GCM10007301_38950 [Azorhizobium oxalatiphilum]|uniref:Serine protease n=1 Tax=Azorhizobium oxalatiphilum TaxID=980631 RepID=A0A917FGF3_9HYPH|nr:serine protease [Azorhizobium oxalatiphilum]GGF75274.1 hypothetical protein GCM10007301_38950 [Azorhizobium oxalatiphilum]